MLKSDVVRVGRRGSVVIPARLRKRFGITEGSLLITEQRGDEIVLRPAVAVAHEVYTPERVAEFLLNSAANAEDYERMAGEVRKLGLDPAGIPHERPRGKRGR